MAGDCLGTGYNPAPRSLLCRLASVRNKNGFVAASAWYSNHHLPQQSHFSVPACTLKPNGAESRVTLSPLRYRCFLHPKRYCAFLGALIFPAEPAAFEET